MSATDVQAMLQAMSRSFELGDRRLKDAYWELAVAFNTWSFLRSRANWEKVERRARAALLLAPRHWESAPPAPSKPGEI
jgi:hypothetical protein